MSSWTAFGVLACQVANQRTLTLKLLIGGIKVDANVAGLLFLLNAGWQGGKELGTNVFLRSRILRFQVFPRDFLTQLIYHRNQVNVYRQKCQSH